MFNKENEIVSIMIVSIDITKQKQTEINLIKSEEKFKALVTNSEEIVYIIDTDGTVLLSEGKGLSKLELKAGELVGKSVFKLYKDYPEILKNIQSALKGKSINFEIKIGENHFRNWYTPYLDHESKIIGLLGLSINITEQKKAEINLIESEEKFKALVTNSEEIVYIIGIDGTFILSEGKGLKKLGLKPGQVVGKSVFELYKDYPEMLDTLRRTFKGEIVTYEVQIGDNHFRNWYTPYMDHEGKIIGLFGLSINITEHKISEEKLRLSEERFRIAGEAAYDLIYEWNVETDSLVWFGDIDYMLQYEPGEISRDINAWINLIHPDDIDQMKDAVELHRISTKPINYQYRIKKNDGTWMYWIDHALPQLDKFGLPYKWIGVCTDITDRKNAEEALQKNNEMLSKYLDSAAELVLSLDLEGKITLLNTSGHRLLGYKKGELVGKNWFNICVPESNIKEVKKVFKKLMLGQFENVDQYENNIIRKNGSQLTILWHNTLLKDDNGTLSGLLSTGENITQRKQTEVALMESEERFRTAFESTSDCILIWDKEYNYLYANQAAIDHVGTTRDKVIGKNIKDGLGHIPDFMNIWKKRIDKVIANGEVLHVQDESMMMGEKIFTDSVISPLRTHDDSIIAVCVVYRNITALKKVEMELKNHRNNLEEMIQERTKELEEKNKELDNTLKVFVGRELTIKNLQKRVRALEGKE